MSKKSNGATLAGTLRIGGYVAVVLSGLIIVTFVRPESEENFLHTLGMSLPLVAFLILGMQVILASRLRCLSWPFGLDMVFRFHKAMAFVAFALLVLHPVLIAWSANNWGLLFNLKQPWIIWAGKIALTLLLINAVVSFWRAKLRFDFEKWRLTHNILGLSVLILGFVHGYAIGDDLETLTMRIVWPLVLLLIVAFYLYHKIFRPANLRKHQYVVEKVQQEASDVWTVRLRPPEDRKKFDFSPGQFHFITFHRKGDLPVEEHHWTISAGPSEETIASSIKESGDFTSTIGKTQAGDTAEVIGPYGRFSYALYPEEKDLVFISGGIGITPFMSMLRNMHSEKETRKVLLLWGNRSEKNIVFQDELNQISESQKPQLSVVHYLENPPEGWDGKQGRIDKDALEKQIDAEGFKQRGFYVCCPPPMAKQIISLLRQLGVPSSRIHAERFAL